MKLPISLVTGASGFLGRKLVDLLDNNGHKVFPVHHDQFDLADDEEAKFAIASCCSHFDSPPDYVFHLAAKVSGIGGIRQKPADYFMDNALMGLNIINAVKSHSPFAHLIVAGSVCAYPRFTPVPMVEENLWEGEPEPTNGPYGIAKRMLASAMDAFWQQYHVKGTYMLMANLYGPGDNFDRQTSHVIPALIQKVDASISSGEPVEVWGDGTASRDFLYVHDAARAFLAATTADLPGFSIINIGSGMEITIASTFNVIAQEMGYNGKVVWNSTKPSGQDRRCLALWKAKSILGWEPETHFKDGIRNTVQYYRDVVKPSEGF